MAVTYAVGQRWTAFLAQQLADWTVNRPLVRLVQQAAGVTAIPHATATSITFGTGATVIDTHDMHSETVNPSRVTPNVAGYYLLSGTVCYAARTDFTNIEAGFRLNGSTQGAQTRLFGNTLGTQRVIPAEPIIVQCNGSTDFVELVGNHSNTAVAASTTAVTGSQVSIFQVEFLRPA